MGKLELKDVHSIDEPFSCSQGKNVYFLQPLADFYLPIAQLYGQKLIFRGDSKTQRRAPPFSYYIAEMRRCMSMHDPEDAKKKKPRKEYSTGKGDAEYTRLKPDIELRRFYSIVSENFEFDLIDAMGGVHTKLSAEHGGDDQLVSDKAVLLAIYFCNQQPTAKTGIPLPIRLSISRFTQVVKGMRKALSARQKTRFAVKEGSLLENMLKGLKISGQEAAERSFTKYVKEKDAKYIPQRLGGLKKDSK
jgi:hypothetical protein